MLRLSEGVGARERGWKYLYAYSEQLQNDGTTKKVSEHDDIIIFSPILEYQVC